jgi:hypothetical protein
MSFQEQYSHDSQLLEPGYAGELSPDEFRYIKSELRKSASLRRKWGFRPSAKRLNEKRIRAVARDGLLKNGRAVLASVAVKKK